VAEDVTNPFAAIMGALTNKSAPESERGVRKDNRPGEVNPNLTTQEISRYTKIFGIMKDVIDPDPEAQKISRGTIAAGGDTASQMAAIQAGGNGGGGVNLMGLLGAGLLGTALAIVTDTGHLATMALKLAKLVPIKMLKVLPLVGSLINFGYAYDAFQRDKPFEGLYELTSGIAGLFPGIGTAVSVGMDMIKFMYEYNNPKNENTGERDVDFGTWLNTKASELGAVVWQNIKDGKIPLLSGLYQFGVGIGHMAKLDFAEGFKAWGKIIPAMLGQGANENFLMAFDAFTTLAGNELNDVYQKGKEIATDSWGWIVGVFDQIGSSLRSVFEGAIAIFKDMVRAGQNKIIDIANKIPGIDIDRIEDPDAMSEAEIRQAAWNAQQMRRKQERDARMTPEQQRAEEILHLTPAEQKAFQATNKLPSDIKDGYISKNGNVTAFDDEDSILAAKTGGPIDKMLDGNSKTMSTISDINKNQLSVLISIRNGINALVSQSGKTGPTDIQFPSNKLTTEFYA